MRKWCPRCKWAGNEPEALYCRLCGTELVEQEEKSCPACGNTYITPSNTSFCDRCGRKLANE